MLSLMEWPLRSRRVLPCPAMPGRTRGRHRKEKPPDRVRSSVDWQVVLRIVHQRLETRVVKERRPFRSVAEKMDGVSRRHLDAQGQFLERAIRVARPGIN